MYIVDNSDARNIYLNKLLESFAMGRGVGYLIGSARQIATLCIKSLWSVDDENSILIDPMG